MADPTPPEIVRRATRSTVEPPAQEAEEPSTSISASPAPDSHPEQPRYQPSTPAQSRKKSNKGKGKAPPTQEDQAPQNEAPPAWLAHVLAGMKADIQYGIAEGLTSIRAQLENDARDRSISRGRSSVRSSRAGTPTPDLRRDAGRNSGGDDPRPSTEIESGDQVNSFRRHYRPAKPTTLDDGKTVSFWPWKLKIESIFRTYPSDFAGLDQQLALILESTVGKAQRTLSARLIPGAIDPLETLEQVWSCLEDVTVDKMEKTTATLAYAELKMQPSDLFSDFINTFQELAAKAQTPAAVLRTDLWLKLNYGLQQNLLGVEKDLATFQELKDRAGHVYVQDSFSKKQRPATRQVFSKTESPLKRQVNTGSSYAPASGSFIPTLPLFERKSATPGVRFATPAAEKADHSRKTCYNCGKVGHISPDCTEAKVAIIDLEAEMNQIEPTEYYSGKEDS